jgi:hypothetical protein
MAAIPCVMNPAGLLFAVHCELDWRSGMLGAAILITEASCTADWIHVVAPAIYGGATFELRVPPEVASRDTRFKSYHVRLPVRRITQ